MDFSSLLDNQLVGGGSEEATWGQILEERPPYLHLRSLAFQVHEVVLHYDSSLDWNRGYSLGPLLGVAALGVGIVCGAKCDNWPSRCVNYLRAYVTEQISPLLKTLPNNCFVVHAQPLLGLPWNNAVCSNCMWTSLLLSLIVGGTLQRPSIAPFNGIGFIADAISYTMLWRQSWITWRTMPPI